MNFRKYLIITVIFLLLTTLILSFPIVTVCDLSVVKAVQAIMSGFSDTIPIEAGNMFYGGRYWFLLLLAVLWLIIKRKYISSVLLIFTVQISIFCSDILKNLVSRTRPPVELQITPIDTFSFPSGHSVLNMCFFGICIYLVSRYVENEFLKWFLIGLMGLFILFVGYTRLWLGVHYPTDILGGYLLGYLFVIIFADIEKKLQK